MTKSQIASLASELGYSVDTNDTKAEMISDFMEQQG